MAEFVDSYNPFIAEYPSGNFFVGREKQLTQLYELLSTVESGLPCNLCVVGKGGEGKTSYLDKIVQESRDRGALATRCNLDTEKSAETSIDIVMRALLRELDKTLEEDWKRGKDSTFRTPGLNQVLSDDLAIDFQRIYNNITSAGKNFCVICIDEGQRIHPLALSAFKNAFQLIRMKYMIVISLLNDSKTDNRQAGREILLDLATRSGDPGANRFFQNSTPLGPFDSQTEAAECIIKRLESNKIKFDQEAINVIIEATRAYPGKMISLSHDVYELAEASSRFNVDKELVIEAFTNRNSSLIRKLKEYKETLSGFRMRIYRELTNFKEGATPLEIMKKINPSLDSTYMIDFSKPVRHELDEFCKTDFCHKINEDSYLIPEPEYSYSIKLVMDII